MGSSIKVTRQSTSNLSFHSHGQDKVRESFKTYDAPKVTEYSKNYSSKGIEGQIITKSHSSTSYMDDLYKDYKYKKSTDLMINEKSPEDEETPKTSPIVIKKTMVINTEHDEHFEKLKRQNDEMYANL